MEKYEYKVVDSISVVLIEEAKNLTEFCKLRNFEIILSFVGMAIIEDIPTRIRYGVTWKKVE